MIISFRELARLVGFATLTATSYLAAAAPDVSMTVRLVDDGELLVNRTVRGAFDVPLVVDRPGLVRVEMTIPRPVNGQRPVTRYRYSVERGRGVPPFEVTGEGPFDLIDMSVNRCEGPNATSNVPDSGRFLCIMPRVA